MPESDARRSPDHRRDRHRAQLRAAHPRAADAAEGGRVMPVPVTDLKPGDRVLLNCPKARGQAKREAQFKGIYKSITDTLSEYDATAILRGPGTDALFESGQAVAGFILQTGDPATFLYPSGEALHAPHAGGTSDLTLVLRIEPDGSLREETGMRVFIERRMRMGQG
jgi:hypothetical protein